MFNPWSRDIGIIELHCQSHRISLFHATDASGQKEKAKPITPASIESTSEARRQLTRNSRNARKRVLKRAEFQIQWVLETLE